MIKLINGAAFFKNSSIPDDKLHLPAYCLFSLIKMFALKSKHDGFREEQEWRLVYLPERDPTGKFKDRFKLDYFVTPRGIEPKLKFKISPFNPDQKWTFQDILERIILGPSQSSWLAQRGVERMLETVHKPEFRAKVSTSRIPLRPL